MNELLQYIEKYHQTTQVGGALIEVKIRKIKILIDTKSQSFKISHFRNFSNKRIFNLKNKENWSALILIIELFKKGYTKDEIYLEKTWKLGHNNSGSLDIAIYQKNKPFHFIEIKKEAEINSYIDLKKEKKTKQLFTYIFQEKDVNFASYYTFNFKTSKHIFFNIEIDERMKQAISSDDLYDIWNKSWNKESLLLQNNKFNYEIKPIKYDELNKINENSVKIIFNQFLTILRQNSVSDKSNAFDKIINLFIAKVYDELKGNSVVNINGYEGKIMNFQFIDKVDNDLTFIKRINNLYREGMEQYMNKEIIDYSDKEIDVILKNNKNHKIREIIDNLRLKKNNAFAFIEVFDEKTFKENNLILIEIVKLLQNYKFKYNNKYQYLGDFFEELLNTSWKQESGQFFTPMPLVEFMINSLPIKENIEKKIENSKKDFIPKMIDYACGSGHFLVSYMDKVQKIINEQKKVDNKQINKLIDSYKSNHFSWAKENVVGIEKDYRLAKTTKIANFLNGDGEVEIINGDGINKFSSNAFINTVLHSQKFNNEIFDYVIANPPFSVGGFMKNISKNKINDKDFTLLKTLKDNSSEIEVLFVERTWQLLKSNGIASIILPRSILTAGKYQSLRNFIFDNFKILSIFESADITFSGTTTSPVILFLEKLKNKIKLNYDVLVINSPKMKFKTTKEEKNFLGYSFSTDKNKLGISITNSNLVDNYSTIVNDFIQKGTTRTNDHSFIKNINDIIVKNERGGNLVYTKNAKKNNIANWTNLKKIGFKINPTSSEIESNLEYLEIGAIKNNKINIKNFKKKTTKRICKKGDLLISSMPSHDKVVIAEKSFYVSSAIFILRSNEDMNKKIFKYLKNNKNNIFYDMKVFLDGFKITYGKINAFNLMNNIYFKIEDIN